MKHIVCFSGGHSSALVAVEVARRHGLQDLVLLNHDINPRVEDADIKRFKREVSEVLQTPITYANYTRWETWDQFDIARYHSAWKTSHDTVLCTHRLKTEPFLKWLDENLAGKEGVVYYGFDASEPKRIQRRSQIMGALGYKTDFPLALWPRTIHSIRELGIEPPLTYSTFRHANCVGCVKGGRQHWYVVFCTRPDIWEKAKAAEEDIGYTILKDVSLTDLEKLFARMKCAGIEATERLKPQTFWASVRKAGIDTTPDPADLLPCECTEVSIDDILS